MKSLPFIGLLLIVLGIAGLAINGISFTEHKTVVDAGPLKVTADQEKTVPIPTYASVAAIVAGIGLAVIGFSRRRA